MAAQDAFTTGADARDGLRQRNPGQSQPNGSYVPKDVADKMDEKTKEKVGRSG